MFNFSKTEKLKNQIQKVRSRVFEENCDQLQTVVITPQIILKKRPPIDLETWSQSQKQLWDMIENTHNMRYKEDGIIPSKYTGVKYLHELIKIKNQEGKFTGETRRKIQFG